MSVFKALRALEPLVETITEVVELEAGGSLTLSLFADGSYQLGIETDALCLRCPLTARDVRALRGAAGVMVLGGVV